MLKAFGAPHWVNVFLLLFLSLSLVLPWKAFYGAFLFAGVFPAVLWTSARKGTRPEMKDRTVWLALCLMGYMVLSTFLPDGLLLKEQYQVIRWGLSTAVFVLAVFVASQRWLRKPLFYSRIIVSVVLVSSVVTISHYFLAGQYPARISGFGYLSHPILGPAALISFWAIGMVTYQIDESRKYFDYAIIGISSFVVFVLVMLSQSRGPLIALLTFIVVFSLAQVLVKSRAGERKHVVGFIALGLVLGGMVIISLDNLLPSMFARGVSLRPQIWLAVLQNPPDSLWFGAGAASDFRDSVAGKVLLAQTGAAIKHPHDLFFNTLHFAGIVGACLFSALLIWVLIRIFRMSRKSGRRLRPFALGLYLLILLLNLTDGHMLVYSPSPDWLFFWMPIIYLISLVKFYETREPRIET